MASSPVLYHVTDCECNSLLLNLSRGACLSVLRWPLGRVLGFDVVLQERSVLAHQLHSDWSDELRGISLTLPGKVLVFLFPVAFGLKEFPVVLRIDERNAIRSWNEMRAHVLLQVRGMV
jgi:hypothetical protein